VDDDPLWLMLSAVLRAENAADHSVAVLTEIKSLLAQQADILRTSTRAALLGSINETAAQFAEHLAQPNRRLFESAYKAGRLAIRVQAFGAALLAVTVAAGMGILVGSMHWNIPMSAKFAFFFNVPMGYLFIAQFAGLAIAGLIAIIGKRDC